MSDLDALLANITAENLALRSLLTGLLIEMIRRGHVGVVSNAFSYASAPLEGLTHYARPSRDAREKARQVIQELRDELLGVSGTDRPTAANGGPPGAS
ncbi:hypothetical protein [Sphingobium nicotianae]|uniref:Uncharacterized protein n=1 Tax=Sphingobium nicotianae TaxID=2782607 RepID=A0A9X1DBA2_9SPHN|nr:hypothetical protein [Sphingobium nicotianae]MBT2186774.1 hypothetical protein [Sphingobium nicotianae]